MFTLRLSDRSQFSPWESRGSAHGLHTECNTLRTRRYREGTYPHVSPLLSPMVRHLPTSVAMPVFGMEQRDARYTREDGGGIYRVVRVSPYLSGWYVQGDYLPTMPGTPSTGGIYAQRCTYHGRRGSTMRIMATNHGRKGSTMRIRTPYHGRRGRTMRNSVSHPKERGRTMRNRVPHPKGEAGLCAECLSHPWKGGWSMRRVYLSHPWEGGWSMRRGSFSHPMGGRLVYAQRLLLTHGREAGLCAEASFSLRRYTLVYSTP